MNYNPVARQKLEREVMTESNGQTYLLVRTNVDGYPCREKFETKPSQESLFQILYDYFDEETSLRCAEELFNAGYTSVNDSASTVYELFEL